MTTIVTKSAKVNGDLGEKHTAVQPRLDHELQMLFLRLPVDFLTLVLLEKGHRWAMDARWELFRLLDGAHGYFCDVACELGKMCLSW